MPGRNEGQREMERDEAHEAVPPNCQADGDAGRGQATKHWGVTGSAGSGLHPEEAEASSTRQAPRVTCRLSASSSHAWAVPSEPAAAVEALSSVSP